MHDKTFPQSEEPVDKQSDRAVTALQYEDDAGLGFRRTERQVGVTNEYDPDATLGMPDTTGQLVAAYFASAGVILGGVAWVYKPLLFAFLAFIMATVGLAAGGKAARIGKLAYIITGVGFFFGTWLAMYNEAPLF